MRLLLIDDDASLTSILRLALSDEGFTVDVHHDGVAGLRSFAAHPPDLVLLDVLMPELDGLEVCRRIR